MLCHRLGTELQWICAIYTAMSLRASFIYMEIIDTDQLEHLKIASYIP